ncbi:hypothetical protein D3C78_1379740 [compost metagenome]
MFQECHGCCWQVADHVFDQIIHKTGLTRQQAIAIEAFARVGLERDGHHLQADGPAVGRGVNGVGQVKVNVLVQIGLQERQRLIETEAQVRAVDFAQLGHRPEPAQLQIGKYS